MDQLRRVSIAVAIAGFVLAVISGSLMFFVVEAPILVTIFVACSAIALGCFALAAVAAYFGPES